MQERQHIRKLVDGNDDLDTELLGVLDVPSEVLATLLECDKILLGVCVS